MANPTQSTAPAPKAKATAGFSLPFVYRFFFLLVEPISALVGAYYALFDQETYLQLTHAASAVTPIPTSTSIVLAQLGNLYFFFAINEALVLRSTSDIFVWKTVLFCLLVGDLGHLYTVNQLGVRIYWDIFNWNAIDIGNIPFVYLGATMRIAFLAGIGFPSARAAKTTKAT
ncbi:hypothetical protein QBC40DRAFT_45979 [Triangularia verruculosa]|uniref:DUF7704 domain-containing protein n=1 Tax=Triangularia verruculosa TaxID=2587418 RepID=A0AAN7AX39_9PEZI|nr:hypothetical protein QBC40DRAFT_45979 [Triangularia verruculosa]